MEKSVKRLVMIGSTAEADRYLPSAKGGDVCIALSPKVRSYLLKRGVIAEDTSPYFTSVSHENVLLASDKMLKWIRERVELPDSGTKIRSAYKDWLIFWVRVALHNFMWVAEVVSNAVEAHRPDSVCASLSGSRTARSLYIEAEENYTGKIAAYVAEYKDINFEDMMAGVKEDHVFDRLKDIIVLIPDIFYRYWRFKAWQCFISARLGILRQRVVFLTSPKYQMDAMAADMQRSIPSIRFEVLKSSVIMPLAVPVPVIRLFWPGYARAIIGNRQRILGLERAIETAAEEDVFKYRGIPVAGLLVRKMRTAITDNVIGLMLWTVRLNKVIDSVKPAALISNGTRADDVALAEICAAKNIPDILISHGSHVPPKDEYERIEWGELSKGLILGPYSHTALQSPLAEAYHRLFPAASRGVRTGPLIWGRAIDRSRGMLLFKKMFGDKCDRNAMNIIVHAGTPKMSKAPRFYVYETSDEYVRALSDLARAIEKIPDTALIIKLRPSREISPDDIETLVGTSEKVRLVIDEPFGDVLAMSDLLVSFSSTTIEEALQNRIPVLQYGGGGRYQHIVAHRIRTGESVPARAVYHVAEPEDLDYAIRGILTAVKTGDAGLYSQYAYPETSRQPLAETLIEAYSGAIS